VIAENNLRVALCIPKLFGSPLRLLSGLRLKAGIGAIVGFWRANVSSFRSNERARDSFQQKESRAFMLLKSIESILSRAEHPAWLYCFVIDSGKRFSKLKTKRNGGEFQCRMLIPKRQRSRI
jgi:hypothetical protein